VSGPSGVAAQSGVLAAIVERSMGLHLGPLAAINPRGFASRVFDLVEALEREQRVRVVRARADVARAAADWLTAHRFDRSLRKEASKRCASFGMSLAASDDETSRAHGLLLSELAQRVAPGAIDDLAIFEFVGRLGALETALRADADRLNAPPRSASVPERGAAGSDEAERAIARAYACYVAWQPDGDAETFVDFVRDCLAERSPGAPEVTAHATPIAVSVSAPGFSALADADAMNPKVSRVDGGPVDE
jgi:hypothetical protein